MEKIFWKSSVDSTLIWAKEEAKKSVGKGRDRALFVADEQTAGKGRLGRVWTSVPGENIYMTLLLMRPEVRIENASSLTLVMGLSVAEAVEGVVGVTAGIKWPNDIVLSGKKICGILTEMQIKEQKPEFIMIGVGINVNQKEFQEELRDKATSVFLETGRELSRENLIEKVAECFWKNYDIFLKTQDLSLLKEDYEKRLLNKNQQVRILEKATETIGTARGITDTGELLVEDLKGEMRKVFSGEVSVRGLYSYV